MRLAQKKMGMVARARRRATVACSGAKHYVITLGLHFVNLPTGVYNSPTVFTSMKSKPMWNSLQFGESASSSNDPAGKKRLPHPIMTQTTLHLLNRMTNMFISIDYIILRGPL